NVGDGHSVSLELHGGAVNDGEVSLTGSGTVTVGDFSGTGTVDISEGGSFYANSKVDPGQTIEFLDATGLLGIAHPKDFHASIAGMRTGDTLFLNYLQQNQDEQILVDEAHFDSATGELNLYYQHAHVYTLMLSGVVGQLTFTPEVSLTGD